MTVRTRFAPSPTGALHIGSARTALFNWIYSRAKGGEFLLRIEDTDKERSKSEHNDVILSSLEWLGIDIDEEIVYQSALAPRHQEIAKALLDAGHAYRCYTSAEELQAMREEAQAKGEHFRYPNIWRDRDPGEAPAGVAPVIRIKAPISGDMVIRDHVLGEVRKNHEELDDFIIQRSDGSPTYNLSVVVDDHDMEITHIIRGDDHMNNAFRQKVIYDALGWKTPEMAHIPLIHGADGKKMSKRHGATGVDDYKAMGILPEAMRNYLLRLGWGHGDEEILSLEKMLELFDLDRIGRSAARFDVEKLRAFNAHYLRQTSDEDLVTKIIPLLDARGATISDTARIWMLKGMAELKERARDLNELAEAAHFYTQNRPLAFDEKAQEVLTDEAKATLDKLKLHLSMAEPFDPEHIRTACKTLTEEETLPMKAVMMPLRAALTGTTKTPDIANIAAIFGKEETLARLDEVINSL